MGLKREDRKERRRSRSFDFALCFVWAFTKYHRKTNLVLRYQAFTERTRLKNSPKAVLRAQKYHSTYINQPSSTAPINHSRPSSLYPRGNHPLLSQVRTPYFLNRLPPKTCIHPSPVLPTTIPHFSFLQPTLTFWPPPTPAFLPDHPLSTIHPLRPSERKNRRCSVEASKKSGVEKRKAEEALSERSAYARIGGGTIAR